MFEQSVSEPLSLIRYHNTYKYTWNRGRLQNLQNLQNQVLYCCTVLTVYKSIHYLMPPPKLLPGPSLAADAGSTPAKGGKRSTTIIQLHKRQSTAPCLLSATQPRPKALGIYCLNLDLASVETLNFGVAWLAASTVQYCGTGLTSLSQRMPWLILKHVRSTLHYIISRAAGPSDVVLCAGCTGARAAMVVLGRTVRDK